LWGLAFKPNTDDMREAASRVLIQDLLDAGATVSAYDPVAMDEASRIFKNIRGLSFAKTQNLALDGADALVIVTEWKEFRSPDFSEIKQRIKGKVIFDGRNMYEPEVVKNAGLEYRPIGRLIK
jgi:UDPglucose 6-dehydrogenase